MLVEKGARDFAPRQVAQQPAAPAQSTTNVYVQPSAPAQSSSSSSSGSSTSNSSTAQKIINDINRAFEAPIENGRYRMSGGSDELSFAGIAKAGNVYYKDASGTTHNGTYSIVYAYGVRHYSLSAEYTFRVR